MTKDDSLIILGRLSGPHGLKGWVKVLSDTRPSNEIFDYRHWLISDGDHWKQVVVENGRVQGKGLIVKLEGSDDRDQAEAIRNRKIAIHRDQLEVLSDSEFYWSDLIGLKVKSVEGFDFGQVDHLVETGANDVMVVKGDKERLVPFIQPDVVRKVDLDAGMIEVDWDPEF